MNNKPKILILVDNSKWCWHKTMEDMIYCMPEYDCTLIPAHEFQMMDDLRKWDFIYIRGNANEFISEDNERMMLPYISTLCTGGKLLEDRIKKIDKYAKKGWALITQNKVAYHRAKKEGYHRVFLIPNGVNTNVYRPSNLKNKKRCVGIAGNIHDRPELKGYNYLIDAVNNIPKLEIKSASNKEPLSYEQMVDFYQSLYIYAQPSDSEGCSNSVMEAMACGLPVLIVKGVGYHGEVCRDATEFDDGEVIFVERDEEDIEMAIRMLLHDRKLYQRVSENARKFALQHDWVHIAQKYREVFSEFLPEARSLKSDNSYYKSFKEVKIPENYAHLEKEVYDFMSARQIPHTVGNVMNILRQRGYMG